MAHNIAVKADGTAEFFSNGAAWHKLGQVVDTAQTWEQAMKLAGLDWEVEKRQLYEPTSKQWVNAYGVFRLDNEAFLGAVGPGYAPLQNHDQFDFVDTLLEENKGSHYETAGALGKGERVFCLASVGGGFDVHGIGDKHESYLCFLNAHDGSRRATVFLTEVRVVCQNTLNMALEGVEDKAGKKKEGAAVLYVRHTKNAKAKLNLAQKLMSGALQTKASLQEKLEALATRKITKRSMSAILNELFPSDEVGHLSGPAITAVDKILELYKFNDDNAFPEIAGTAYNVLNALTEYTDFHKPVRVTEARADQSEEAIRADNALFGEGAKFKTDALEVILNATKDAPFHTVRQPFVSMSGAQTVTLELEREAAAPTQPIPGADLLADILENGRLAPIE